MKRTIAFLLALSSVLLIPMLAHAQQKKDEKPPYYLKNEQLDEKLGVDEGALAPHTIVQVVYFHRVPGCETCQLMSKLVYETLDTKFKEEVKTKSVILRYQNFEDKKNAELVKKLKVQSPTLAILLVKNGKLVKAKTAGQIWSLAKDKTKFIEYVEKEVKGYALEIKEAAQ